jgi:hypothetical protein
MGDMNDTNTEQYPARIRFLHAVGKSTLRQGITVPVSAQTVWARQIRKGASVPVEIRFGDGRRVQVTLRRIDNARGHLQFRYEAKEQSSLRDYLQSEFAAPESADRGPIEIAEVTERVFTLRPIPGNREMPARLVLCDPLFHNISREEACGIPELRHLGETLSTVQYEPEIGQREYNSRIGQAMLAKGWRKEVRLLNEIGLRVDFECNGIWIEVEFGNARTYYQDYIKFSLAHRLCSARCGLLLCPTEPFANMLCELGRRRAAVKHTGRKSPPTYSGMMTFEKAVREFPHLRFILTSPLIVAGIQLGRGGQGSRWPIPSEA